MLVRIDIPENPNADAQLTTEDGKIRMPIASALVRKRVTSGERRVYFDATVEHEVLELGDRKPDLGW